MLMLMLLAIFSSVCGALTTILFFAYVYYHEHQHEKYEEEIGEMIKDKFLEYECSLFGDKNGNSYKRRSNTKNK